MRVDSVVADVLAQVAPELAAEMEAVTTFEKAAVTAAASLEDAKRAAAHIEETGELVDGKPAKPADVDRARAVELAARRDHKQAQQNVVDARRRVLTMLEDLVLVEIRDGKVAGKTSSGRLMQSLADAEDDALAELAVAGRALESAFARVAAVRKLADWARVTARQGGNVTLPRGRAEVQIVGLDPQRKVPASRLMAVLEAVAAEVRPRIESDAKVIAEKVAGRVQDMANLAQRQVHVKRYADSWKPDRKQRQGSVPVAAPEAQPVDDELRKTPA